MGRVGGEGGIHGRGASSDLASPSELRERGGRRAGGQAGRQRERALWGGLRLGWGGVGWGVDDGAMLSPQHH